MQGISPQWFLHFPTFGYGRGNKCVFAGLCDRNILLLKPYLKVVFLRSQLKEFCVCLI